MVFIILVSLLLVPMYIYNVEQCSTHFLLVTNTLTQYKEYLYLPPLLDHA